MSQLKIFTTTVAVTALKRELPLTVNEANTVAHLEYRAINAFIEGLPDGWRTSFVVVAPTSLEQALSAQAQDCYRVLPGSNITKICQLLRESLTLLEPTDLRKERRHQFQLLLQRQCPHVKIVYPECIQIVYSHCIQFIYGNDSIQIVYNLYTTDNCI